MNQGCMTTMETTMVMTTPLRKEIFLGAMLDQPLAGATTLAATQVVRVATITPMAQMAMASLFSIRKKTAVGS